MRKYSLVMEMFEVENECCLTLSIFNFLWLLHVKSIKGFRKPACGLVPSIGIMSKDDISTPLRSLFIPGTTLSHNLASICNSKLNENKRNKTIVFNFIFFKISLFVLWRHTKKSYKIDFSLLWNEGDYKLFSFGSIWYLSNFRIILVTGESYNF